MIYAYTISPPHFPSVLLPLSYHTLSFLSLLLHTILLLYSFLPLPYHTPLSSSNYPSIPLTSLPLLLLSLLSYLLTISLSLHSSYYYSSPSLLLTISHSSHLFITPLSVLTSPLFLPPQCPLWRPGHSATSSSTGQN